MFLVPYVFLVLKVFFMEDRSKYHSADVSLLLLTEVGNISGLDILSKYLLFFIKVLITVLIKPLSFSRNKKCNFLFKTLQVKSLDR